MLEDPNSIRTVSSVLIAVIFILAGGLASNASSQTSYAPAERWILHQASVGDDANLQQKFPIAADRVVRALFLKRLLTNEIPMARVRPWGIRISHATIKGTLDLTNTEIPHHLKLQDCTFEDDLILVAAHFKSRLRLAGTTFYGHGDFRYMVIDGGFEGGKIQFRQRELEDVTNEPTANFGNVKVAGPLFLNGAVFEREGNFYDAEVGGNFEANDATFNRPINFELMRVRGHTFFNGTHFNGPARFFRAKVTENFEAENAHFNDTSEGVDFEGLTADSALFRHSEFKGPARFYRVNVINNLEASKAQFYFQKEFADFRNMVIGGQATYTDATFNGPFSLYSTSVGRGFYAEGAYFNGDTTFDGLKVDTLGLRNAHFNGPLSLAGMTYRETESDLLPILAYARYESGAYAELEDYFRRTGNKSKANLIYITQRRRERSSMSMLNPRWWLDFLVLDLLVGYGRRPWLVLIPTCIFLILGWWIYRSRDFMDPQKPEYADRHYSAYIYTLDLFLPIVDLQSANVWMPKQVLRRKQIYLTVHVIAGWILVTILVAALTGVLK